MATTTKLGEYTATRSNLFSIEPMAIYVDWTKNLSRMGEEPPVDDELIKLALSMMPRSDANPTGCEQLNPITCRKNDDGVIEAILGYTRLKAALWLVESGTCSDFKINYVVKRLNDRQAAIANMNENIHRKTPHPIQTAHAIGRMMDEYAMTVEAVAETLGMSVGWCNNLLKLVSLPQELQDEVSDANLSATAAIELAKLPEAEQISTYKELAENDQRVTAARVKEAGNPADKTAKGPLGKLKKFMEKKSHENEGGATLAEMIVQFLDNDVTTDELSRYWDAVFEMLTQELSEAKEG